jgi:uncharacterized protein
MLFVITALDRPGALERRLAHRPAHLDYLKAAGERIKAAGALLNNNEQPMGSMIVIEADDRAAAERFAAGDPFSTEGIFEQVTVRPFRPALGAWIA